MHAHEEVSALAYAASCTEFHAVSRETAPLGVDENAECAPYFFVALNFIKRVRRTLRAAALARNTVSCFSRRASITYW
jgi:hypothetical protein